MQCRSDDESPSRLVAPGGLAPEAVVGGDGGEYGGESSAIYLGDTRRCGHSKRGDLSFVSGNLFSESSGDQRNQIFPCLLK